MNELNEVVIYAISGRVMKKIYTKDFSPKHKMSVAIYKFCKENPEANKLVYIYNDDFITEELVTNIYYL